jgi:hypothetical protein
MMKEYIKNKNDNDLGKTKETPFEDVFEEDMKRLKKIKKAPKKDVNVLVKKIQKNISMKQTAMDQIESDHMKNSCFKKHIHLIRASFELDEMRNKKLFHQYVDAMSKAK